jgi:hypothetical protein
LLTYFNFSKRKDGNAWNSTQPFRSDCITTSDLLSFAEQIACAMEYLAAKNVIYFNLIIKNIFIFRYYIAMWR